MRWLVGLLPAVLMAAPGIEATKEFRTPSGLKVILVERHDRPVLRLHLMVAWERGDLSAGELDQALALPSVMKACGAGNLNRQALERRLADRGIRVGFSGLDDSLSWSVFADSQDQEDAFAMLSDLVFRPALGGLIEPQGPAPSSELRFRTSLGFPSAEPFGAPLGIAERFSIHHRLVRPDHSVLVIQGDLSLTQARQLVLLHFGTWFPAAIKAEVPAQATSEPRSLQPGKGAWTGSRSPGGDAKSRAAHIAASMLLARWLREEARDEVAFEAFRPDGDAGPWLFGLTSTAEPQRRLQNLLEGLRHRRCGKADLAYVQRVWQAEHSDLALHPEDQVSALARAALKGDPGPFVLALQPEEVNEALRSRLAPEALCWLIPGKAEPLRPK